MDRECKERESDQRFVSASAHTPGPWIIHPKAKAAVVGSTGFVVASCGGHDNSTADREALWNELCANARLIAEAGTVSSETGLTPRQLADQRAELLAALESAVAEECAYQSCNSWIDQARSAIAKARGQK